MNLLLALTRNLSLPSSRAFCKLIFMKLFIDSADVEKIKEAWSWSIIDGVTTNPSHVAKTGRKHLEVYREICDIVDGPISLETITLTAPEMAAEGRALAKMHKNVVVKIP